MTQSDMNDILVAVDVLQLHTLERIHMADVRRSFCQAVKRDHPDKVGGSMDAFNEVMHAYNTLTNYFKNKQKEESYTDQSSRSFHQKVVRRDMVFSEAESSFFFQCRCGELIGVPKVAVALDVRVYRCETCSLVYTLEQD